jgi:DNA-binding GntR family transcriptional regulator
MGLPDLQLDRPRSADRVYDAVKLMAISFGFRPGERINEIELAARLNVSRTPLREALYRLVSEGFLTILHNRGFFGRMLDAKEIFDLYEFRCALEQIIVRLVCERATDTQLSELEVFARSWPTEANGKTLEGLRHDEDFHLRMARLTGNAEYVRSLESVNARIHFVRWIDLRGHTKLDDAAHSKMVKLLRKRDPEACAAHVGAVIRRRYDEIVQVIRVGIAEIYVGPEAAS